MITITCKMCGCPNNVEKDQETYICSACNTEQTLPKLNNDNKINLFNKANDARMNCEFDKAISYYQQIIAEYDTDSEAYYGICLSKYGIEYVDDPKTNKKIPTCHRTLYNSIFDDVDYKDAIKYADVVARRLYQSEAETIDKIQKSIIAISQKETPYDIFICYKETTSNNQRTRDSYVAEDIYNELTNKGYKVFFSRITLESKLGLQYEPIIFNALQTSKIMLVIGSKPEYFNAVWVKNEWSRYLQFMEEQKGNKYMIPCFRDMEAYDMPKEFLALQSQNLDKLGAKQDLIRVIDKIFGKHGRNNTEKIIIEKPSTNQGLLKRARILIKNDDFKKADELLENYLNEDPECCEAYILKILVDYEINAEESIQYLDEPLDKNINYINALEYADEDTKSRLKKYNEYIKYEPRYNEALSLKDSKKYDEAIKLFTSIMNYRDSQAMIQKCKELKIENLYSNGLTKINEKKYDDAISTLEKIIDFRDSKELIEKCKELKKENIELKKEQDYSNALAYMKNKKYKEASDILSCLNEYKDSKKLLKKCFKELLAYIKELYKSAIIDVKNKNIYSAEEKELIIINDLKKVPLDEECERLKKEYINVCYNLAYKNGFALLRKNNYEGAIKHYSQIINHKNSKKIIKNCKKHISFKEDRPVLYLICFLAKIQLIICPLLFFCLRGVYEQLYAPCLYPIVVSGFMIVYHMIRYKYGAIKMYLIIIATSVAVLLIDCILKLF